MPNLDPRSTPTSHADAPAAVPIGHIVDTGRYPLDTDRAALDRLAGQMRIGLERAGACTLPGFLRADALDACVAQIAPLMAARSFHHAKAHNIYFSDREPVPPGSGLLAPTLHTSNHALTGDQLRPTALNQVYLWPALRHLLAAALDKPALHPMADPLACLNVMGYGPDDRIGWHFDRAEFTVTILLQAATAGGVFRYRHNLRAADDPNYGGVADLLAGRDGGVTALPMAPGTLTVFRGFRSPHGTTPVEGSRLRLVAILSYMDAPGVTFSAADRLQFYGRAEPEAQVPDQATQ